MHPAGLHRLMPDGIAVARIFDITEFYDVSVRLHAAGCCMLQFHIYSHFVRRFPTSFLMAGRAWRCVHSDSVV